MNKGYFSVTSVLFLFCSFSYIYHINNLHLNMHFGCQWKQLFQILYSTSSFVLYRNAGEFCIIIFHPSTVWSHHLFQVVVFVVCVFGFLDWFTTLDVSNSCEGRQFYFFLLDLIPLCMCVLVCDSESFRTFRVGVRSNARRDVFVLFQLI